MPRLPTPGGDEGNWGTVLNEFLEVAHNTDGSPKNEALVAHEADTNNPHAVTAAQAEALPEDATINAQDEAYTLAASDAGKIIECDGTFTVTLPNGLDTGFQCVIVNVGTGTITLSAEATLQSADNAVTLTTQYNGAAVYHRGGNVWLAMGGLA